MKQTAHATAVVRRPARLDDNEYVVVTCDRATKDLSLVTPDQQSHALGNFWDATEDAVPYLGAALGGGATNRRLADEVVSSAWNFGAAVLHVPTSLVSRVDQIDQGTLEKLATLYGFWLQDVIDAEKDYDPDRDAPVLIDP